MMYQLCGNDFLGGFVVGSDLVVLAAPMFA